MLRPSRMVIWRNISTWSLDYASCRQNATWLIGLRALIGLCRYSIGGMIYSRMIYSRTVCNFFFWGEFTVADFQSAYMVLDEELDNKLSKCNKVLRIKKRWALDDLWLQTFKNKQYLSMRYVFFLCVQHYRRRTCCSGWWAMLEHIGEKLARERLVVMWHA